MRRRRFLQTGILGFLSLPVVDRGGNRIQSHSAQRRSLPRRILGRTGERISIIGLGGIVVMNEPLETASKIVGDAVEHGVNYFDVAPSYGNAEKVLGEVLKPYREQVFLSCKTQERTRRGAEEELHRKSLKNIGPNAGISLS